MALNVLGGLTALLVWAGPAAGAILPFEAETVKDYLIIGQIKDSVANPGISITTAHELGGINGPLAASAVTPPTETPDLGDSSIVNESPITTANNAVQIPSTSQTTYDGNIAATGRITGANTNSGKTSVSFSDAAYEVFANLGIQFPGSDNSSGTSNVKWDDAAGGDAPRKPTVPNDGIDEDVDFTATTGNGLFKEITDAKTWANANFTTETTITIPTNGGDLDQDTFVQLNEGLNIIDFDTGGSSDKNDITIKKNLVFMGAPGGNQKAIVFVKDDSSSNKNLKFKTSNGNILVDENMGLMDVVFISLGTSNDNYFDFSNTIINGAALWYLGMANGGHVFNNVTGCTQLLGDKITLSSENRLTNCAFGEVSDDGGINPAVDPVPLPAAAWLFGSAMLGMIGVGYRRRQLRRAA